MTAPKRHPSGYEVHLRAFIPCHPNDGDTMLAALREYEAIREALAKVMQMGEIERLHRTYRERHTYPEPRSQAQEGLIGERHVPRDGGPD